MPSELPAGRLNFGIYIMPELLRQTLFSNSFMPHGFCLRWDPVLLPLMVAANLGIALAYFSIPASLWYFIRRRRDLAYSWLFRLFAVFITACGLTHVAKVVTLYQPYYWFETLMDVFTALVSMLTAFLLWPVIPKALQLRSPKELAETNTKLNMANEQLTEVNKELATINEELMVARDEALEASNLKSAFVANISHELRTPLSGIMGMNELLQETSLSDEQQELVSAVKDSGQSLLSIVNDLLDLSKIEAGKMTLESSACNPIAIIHDCLQVVTVSANHKGLLLKTGIDARVPSYLLGDSVRIHQVLLNLVSNAVKFTTSGSVTVRAAIDAEDDHFVTVRFVVDDTGIGLSESEQRCLFVPFSQVDVSSTRRYGGTGLGLAISKRLVELMGGDIGLTSTKGAGSSFWFTVTLKRSSGDIKVGEAAQSKQDKPFAQITANVLVVEDNTIVQLLTLKQLEHLGLKARGVANGKAALEELVRSDYALILMDCHLPELDGFEATRSIRAQEAGTDRHIPIVALTAGAMRRDPEKCFEAGMDDYFSKPYTLMQLRHKIERFVKTSSLVP